MFTFASCGGGVKEGGSDTDTSAVDTSSAGGSETKTPDEGGETKPADTTATTPGDTSAATDSTAGDSSTVTPVKKEDGEKKEGE